MAMLWRFGLEMQTDRPSAHSPERSRLWWIAVILGSLICFVGVCVWLSSHRMMWDDEFDAWHLIADPSWRHAFASWNLGADGGPPLYYAIGRLIVMVTGPHPLAVRLYSAGCFWFAAILWTQILKRYFGGTVALCAVAFAFLCNVEFVDQLAQVRFYGQLLLAVTLAVWVALYLEQKQPAPRRCIALSLLAGVFLVISHPLGIIYSANIAAAQLLGKAPFRNRVAAVGATVLSWSALLIFLPGVRAGAQTTNWIQMPTFMGLLHFYNNHPLLFVRDRYVSVLLNIALLCLCVYACWWFLRHRRSEQLRGGSWWLFFCISFALLLTPIEFYIVSHLYKPLFLSRYLLPYSLGLAALAAAGAWLLSRRVSAATAKGLTVLVVVAVIGFAVLTLQELPLSPVSDLEPILRLAKSEPVVFQYDTEVLQAHYYTPSRAGNLYYVLFPLEPGARDTLTAIAAQGYEPELVLDSRFLNEHHEFLYVETPLQPRFYEQDLKGNPNWRSEYVDTINAGGFIVRVFRFTRVDHP